MSKNPPQNSLTEFQKQNWNASIFALMAMGAVGVKVNPPKKNPDNRQIPKPREQNSVDWRLSGLITNQEVPVNPVTAVGIKTMISGPSTKLNPVSSSVQELKLDGLNNKEADEKPSTTPRPAQDMRGLVGQVPTTVAGMRALVDELNNERTGSNSR